MTARIAGSLLVIGSLFKVWDPDGLSDVLRFGGVDPTLSPAISVGLACVELFVGLALVLKPACGPVRIGGAALYGGFAVVVGLLLLSPHPPACGCFGPMRLFQSNRASLGFALSRDLILGAILIVPPTLRATAPGPVSV